MKKTRIVALLVGLMACSSALLAQSLESLEKRLIRSLQENNQLMGNFANYEIIPIRAVCKRDASGDCIKTKGEYEVAFVSPLNFYVFHSSDRGKTWKSDTPSDCFLIDFQMSLFKETQEKGILDSDDIHGLILSQIGSEGNTRPPKPHMDKTHSDEVKSSGKNGAVSRPHTLLARLTGGSRLTSSWLFWIVLFLTALLMIFVGSMIVESNNSWVSILGILLAFIGGTILLLGVIALLILGAFINVLLFVSGLLFLKNFLKS